MKDFLKVTAAVICGFIIVTVIIFMLGFGFLGALLASDNSAPALPKSGVLSIDMSTFAIGEQTREGSAFPTLGGGNPSTIGIWDAVQAINTAATDPAVKYIYLRTDGSMSGISAVEEFRAALERFRKTSGKAVVSYIESPTSGSYYLASVADKVYMTAHEGATTMINGVSSQMIFLGDLLDRLGVNVQLIRHGKYKSAGEMYTRSSASPENREQYQRMVDSMWEHLSQEICESREILPEQLDDAVDNLELNFPQDFVDCGLVDELLTAEELKEQLAVLAVEESYDDVKMIDFPDYVAARQPVSKASKQIAVIYAEGSIVDGSGKSDVAGDRFASLIAKVRADSTVKAVVLRVNSPGGSVLASEKIKSELDLLKETKPLVASYGDYAASGGYWISTNCDRIFSDATTLTGSIGVFGMVPDFSRTASDVLHVNIETVSSNRHGDMYSGMRAFDQAEYDYMLASIESIYDRFTTIVSDARGLPVETVDAVGQGRVWTGSDAATIQLVDQIGTLEDAVTYAAAAAGDPMLANWKVSSYPKPMTQMEEIMSMLGYGTPESALGLSVSAEELLDELGELSRPKVLARMDSEINFCF